MLVKSAIRLKGLLNCATQGGVGGKAVRFGWPFLLIVLVVMGFYWKVWVAGEVALPADNVVGVYFPWLDYKWGYATGVPVKNPMTSDVVSFSYPMRRLAVELLKKGEWPLWNPYILGGTPLLANFQSSPFSPTIWVFFIFDQLTGWSVQVMLQHLLCVSFTFLLLRHWRVSRGAAVLGGIIFSFSGFNVIWSEWNAHALAGAFIPLEVLFVDRWLLRGKWFDGVGLAVGLAFFLLSGYPQIGIYLGVAVGSLLIMRVKLERGFLGRTVGMVAFLLLGSGLAAFQLWPGAELLGLSQRVAESIPYEWAFLPWSKVVTLFAPDYFGNPVTGNYWGPQDYGSNVGFVGVVAGVMAVWGACLIRKRREVVWGVLVLVLSLALAFPTPLSVGLWKSGFLGLKAASSYRCLVLLNLAVAVLAGFGVDYVLDSKRLGRNAWLGLLGVLGVVLGFGGYAVAAEWFGLSQFWGYEVVVRGILTYEVALRNSIFPLGVGVAVALVLGVVTRRDEVRSWGVWFLGVLLIVELFRFGWKYTPFSSRSLVYPKTPVLEFLQRQEVPFRVAGSWVVPSNILMPYRIETVDGYDAMYPLRQSLMIGAINAGRGLVGEVRRHGTVDRVNSSLINFVNGKYVLKVRGKEGRGIDDKRFSKVFEEGSVEVWENEAVLPRAYMVFSWDRAGSEKEVLEKLFSEEVIVGKKVVVEGFGRESEGSGEEKGQVSYLMRKENESEMMVESYRKGLLYVSETWYPGWRAYVDGKETEVYRANLAYRAVEVPEGKHIVRWVYRPESFIGGVKIAILSFVLLLGLAWGTRVMRLRK